MLLLMTMLQGLLFTEILCTPILLRRCRARQVVYSLVSLMIGFQYLVSGGKTKLLSFASSALGVLLLFTFAVWVSYIAFITDKQSLWIPEGTNPSSAEVLRSGEHGLCLLASNGTAYYGGLDDNMCDGDAAY